MQFQRDLQEINKILMDRVIVTIFVITIFVSCTTTPHGNNFFWLEGKWQQTNGEANFHEEWKRLNDSTFDGRGFIVQGSDTLFSEKITLQTTAGKTVYRVEMVTGRVAEFKLTKQSESKLIFEMPENNFPSKISYTKKSDNELIVVLEGTDNGKEIEEEFLFVRQ